MDKKILEYMLMRYAELTSKASQADSCEVMLVARLKGATSEIERFLAVMARAYILDTADSYAIVQDKNILATRRKADG